MKKLSVRQYLHNDGSGLTLGYDKSEADKVIAEKDKMIADLKDSVREALKSVRKLLNAKTEQVMDEVFQRCLIYGEGLVPVEHAMRLVAELRHQKYKRCLAMARWCDAERDIFNLTPKVTKVEFFARWRNRWLKLADKFKEVQQ